MFVSGTKTVTTAGTQVPLSATAGTRIAQIIIQALPTNTGFIYIGDSTVSSSNGIRLEIPVAGSLLPSMTISCTGVGNEVDLNTIYIDSSVNGEGVVFLYEVF
jgi:hypothetical protein